MKHIKQNQTKMYFVLATAIWLSIANQNIKAENGPIALETDPGTTILGARTLSFLLEPKILGNVSLFANVVHADFPDWMDNFINPNNADKGFQSQINIGGGLAADYFLNENKRGFYFGIISLFFEYEVTKKNSAKSTVMGNLIPRIGYRWYPFEKSGFYINPFLGLRYEYEIGETIALSGQNYSAAGLQPFATMHVGYHF